MEPAQQNEIDEGTLVSIRILSGGRAVCVAWIECCFEPTGPPISRIDVQIPPAFSSE